MTVDDPEIGGNAQNMATLHRVQVGDRARYFTSVQWIDVLVTELRGPIGYKGRELVQVERQALATDPVRFEVAVEELRDIVSPTEACGGFGERRSGRPPDA